MGIGWIGGRVEGSFNADSERLEPASIRLLTSPGRPRHGNNWGAVLFSGGRLLVPGGGCIGVVGMATLSALLHGES